MPYIATKTRLIAGQRVKPGDEVDVAGIAQHTLGSLVRTGLIQYRDPNGTTWLHEGVPVPKPPVSQDIGVPAGVESLGAGWYRVGDKKVRGLEEALELLEASSSTTEDIPHDDDVVVEDVANEEE